MQFREVAGEGRLAASRGKGQSGFGRASVRGPNFPADSLIQVIRTQSFPIYLHSG